jgi:hypothetical protein
MSHNITTDGNGSLTLRTPYNADAIPAIRELPGRQWDRAEKVWRVGLDALKGVLELAVRFDWTVAPEVRDRAALNPATSELAQSVNAEATAPKRAEAIALDFDLPPSGAYALPTQDGAVNELAFWLVNRPDEGKWAGWTFLAQQISGDKRRAGAIRPNGTSTSPQAVAILKRITAEAEEAMLRYGRELGVCGHCGRTLTNDESRELGIGPICREKMSF